MEDLLRPTLKRIGIAPKSLFGDFYDNSVKGTKFFMIITLFIGISSLRIFCSIMAYLKLLTLDFLGKFITMPLIKIYL